MLLSGGVTASADELLSARERLLQNPGDGFTRYKAGWLAIEACRTERTDSIDFIQDAILDWTSVVEDPTTVYEDYGQQLEFMSMTCIALSDSIARPQVARSDENRLSVRKQLAEVSRAHDRRLHDRYDPRAVGYLAELATLQLIWRSNSQNGMIAVPVNPVLDGGPRTRTNIDIHAYGNSVDTPVTPVPIQVKVVKQGEYGNYNNRKVLLIGADDNFYYPETDSKPRTKVIKVSEACNREALDGVQDSNAESKLDSSTKRINAKIRKFSRAARNRAK